MEELYILLLTTKSSNIVEDLETLRLLSKVVPDVAGGAREQDVTEKLFELIFAFDEVMTSGGYKEQGVTMQNVKKNLEMESHEEKVSNEEEKRWREADEKLHTYLNFNLTHVFVRIPPFSTCLPSFSLCLPTTSQPLPP